MNIIQTWKTKVIPDHYVTFVDKIKTNNPTCNYMFFDDNDIADFIQNKMPEYKDTFYMLSGKIQQIDFFRYLAIYYYGGLYLDLDIDASESFDTLAMTSPDKCIFPVELKNIGDSLITNQQFYKLIGNYAFYAPAHHPFLKLIIDNIVTQRISDTDIYIGQLSNRDDARDVYVYYRTGPMLVTQSYLDYINNDCLDGNVDASQSGSIILLEPTPYMPNCFGNYGKHCCYGSWRHVHSLQTPMHPSSLHVE